MTIALALLSGVLLAASFPKFGFPALAWIAPAPLIVATAIAARAGRRPRHLFLLGLTTGVAYFGGALYWVVQVMASYGDLPFAVALGVGALLAVYLALYIGLFAAVTGRAVQRFGMAAVWLAPWVWVAGEWARSSLFGGFPWALLGSSQAGVIPIVQFASVAGVYGLSALVVQVAAATAAVTLSRKRAHLVGAIATLGLVGVIAGAGTLRVARNTLVQRGEVVRVGLVQGDIAQDIKWDPRHRDAIIDKYIALSRQVLAAGAAIVIWPEASTPFYFDAEPQFAARVRQLAIQARTPFLIGTDEFVRSPDGKELIYNSATLIGADGRSAVTSYRKMRLVPFGEYVPFQKVLFFVGPLVEKVSDFTAGTEPVVFDVEGRRVSVAICYESVYPWISRAFALRGSQLLATITNDAWFGRSSAAYQHFEQGALRAVEEGRYVVRAANTGISGAVDPYGRVLAGTNLFEPAALTVDVRLLSGRTVYNRIGDVVVWCGLLVTALLVVTGWRRPAVAPHG